MIRSGRRVHRATAVTRQRRPRRPSQPLPHYGGEDLDKKGTTMTSLYDNAVRRIPGVLGAREARKAVLAFARDYPTPQALPVPTATISALAEETARSLVDGRGDIAAFADAVAAEYLAVAKAYGGSQVRQAIGLLIECLLEQERAALAGGADAALRWLHGQLLGLLAEARVAVAEDDDRLEALAAAMGNLRRAQSAFVLPALQASATTAHAPMVLAVAGHVRDLDSVWPEWPDAERPQSVTLGVGGGVRTLMAPPPWPIERIDDPLRPAYDDVGYLRWAAAKPEGTVWVPTVRDLLTTYAAAREYAAARAEEQEQDPAPSAQRPAPGRRAIAAARY